MEALSINEEGAHKSSVEVNRFSLENYDWIGFDLDHTIIRYKLLPLTKHIFRGCVRYLVEQQQYDPKIFEGVEYDHSFFVRGILLDKHEGNFIHISADRKVQIAIHGLNKKLSKEEISRVYQDLPVAFDGFTSERFWAIASWFEMPFFYAFGIMIDWWDNHPLKETLNLSAREVYSKINVDLYNGMGYNFGQWNGGYYFAELRENIGAFVEKRTSVKEFLKRIRTETKTKVFLLTNSGFDYSKLLLDYAFGPDWEDSFDLRVYQASKPYFFTDTSPFRNLKGEILNSMSDQTSVVGGNSSSLIAYLKEKCGMPLDGEIKVCYFGDEMIGDIWIPRLVCDWSTVAVVEELESLERHHEDAVHFRAMHSLTEKGTDASHASPHFNSFFYPVEDKVSFWLHLMHYHSCAYTPCLTRFVNFNPNHQFKAHLSPKVPSKISYQNAANGLSGLSYHLKYHDKEALPVYPQIQAVANSLRYKNSLRSTSSTPATEYYQLRRS